MASWRYKRVFSTSACQARTICRSRIRSSAARVLCSFFFPRLAYLPYTIQSTEGLMDTLGVPLFFGRGMGTTRELVPFPTGEGSMVASSLENGAMYRVLPLAMVATAKSTAGTKCLKVYESGSWELHHWHTGEEQGPR